MTRTFSPTPTHPAPGSLGRAVRWFARALVGFDRSRANVTYVDDPARPVRLVRAVGVLDHRSIALLLGSWDDVTAPHHVHVDVQDACIADAATMARLETALDGLERRRIDVRIVGIDPQHPAIAS